MDQVALFIGYVGIASIISLACILWRERFEPQPNGLWFWLPFFVSLILFWVLR